MRGATSGTTTDFSSVETPRAPVRLRVFITVASILFASAWIVIGWGKVSEESDFDQHLYAIYSLKEGLNPYESIGPGELWHFLFPYFYPLPSAVLALPVAWLPEIVARVILVLVTAGILGWVISRDGWLRFPILLSAPFISTVGIGQSSLLLTAALLSPRLGWVTAIKPNFALVANAANLDRRYLLWTAVPAGVLALVFLAIMPTWPVEWIRTVVESPTEHTPLVLQPGGFLLLIAFARWRTFEGRLLGGLAVMPQTGILYDTLPLFLIARTKAQSWFLWGCSFLAMYFETRYGDQYLGGTLTSADEIFRQFNLFRTATGEMLVWTMYLPALGVLLYNWWKSDSEGRSGRARSDIGAGASRSVFRSAVSADN